MAEGGDEAVKRTEEDGSWGAWGKGWYDSIKEKSTATLELVQKDLNEFVSTIQHDTVVVAAETATKVEAKVQPAQDEEESTTKTVKQGLSKILTSVSNSLKTMTIEDDSTEEQQILLDSGKFAGPDLDVKQSRIYALQKDANTFSGDPEGSLVDFQTWIDTEFDLESRQPVMSALLVNTPEVRSIYTTLVPGSISHALFWQRYFYKLHQVDMEEQRRAALIARVRSESGDDILCNWEDDDDALAPTTKPVSASHPVIVDPAHARDTEMTTSDHDCTTSSNNLPRIGETAQSTGERSDTVQGCAPLRFPSEEPLEADVQGEDKEPHGSAEMLLGTTPVVAMVEHEARVVDRTTPIAEPQVTPLIVNEQSTSSTISADSAPPISADNVPPISTIVVGNDGTIASPSATTGDTEKAIARTDPTTTSTIIVGKEQATSPTNEDSQCGGGGESATSPLVQRLVADSSCDPAVAPSADPMHGDGVIAPTVSLPPRPGSGDSGKRRSPESGSSGSWESIDDGGLKVKTSKHAHHISTPSKSPDIAEVASVASSGVLVNREDASSEEWDELADNGDDDSDELELDGDISEEELNKLVQQAKEKAKDGASNSASGNGIEDEDEDWENWE